jgi:hypothetical protein
MVQCPVFNGQRPVAVEATSNKHVQLLLLVPEGFYWRVEVKNKKEQKLLPLT